VSYDSKTNTMEVLVDGAQYTLVKTKNDSSGIPGTDKIDMAWNDWDLVNFGYEYDLFSDKAVEEMQDNGNNFVAFSEGAPYRRTLALVPVDIMPEVVKDIDSWDKTEATIYMWPVSSWSMNPIYENATTKEVYFGASSFYDTIDDQHVYRQLPPGGYLWGYITVEYRDGWDWQVYITQSAPDYSLYPTAVELMSRYYPESANQITVDSFDGYADVCSALKGSLIDGRGNAAEVAEACGPFYVDLK
jgi:hypothetical protein